MKRVCCEGAGVSTKPNEQPKLNFREAESQQAPLSFLPTLFSSQTRIIRLMDHLNGNGVYASCGVLRYKELMLSPQPMFSLP